MELFAFFFIGFKLVYIYPFKLLKGKMVVTKWRGETSLCFHNGEPLNHVDGEVHFLLFACWGRFIHILCMLQILGECVRFGTHAKFLGSLFENQLTHYGSMLVYPPIRGASGIWREGKRGLLIDSSFASLELVCWYNKRCIQTSRSIHLHAVLLLFLWYSEPLLKWFHLMRKLFAGGVSCDSSGTANEAGLDCYGTSPNWTLRCGVGSGGKVLQLQPHHWRYRPGCAYQWDRCQKEAWWIRQNSV